MAALRDNLGRIIDYLRISVTDRCNLRCAYCMPAGSEEPPYTLLTRDEILEVVKCMKPLGVNHVRLTGGEPLVRLDLQEIISGIRDLGIDDISLTTNGTLLAASAAALKAAGLARVNVSLDSLNQEVFRKMTGFGAVQDVLRGIDAALEAGLSPVKVNCVVVGGLNEDGVGDLALLSKRLPVSVRFIEVMPIGPDALANSRTFVPASAIMAKVREVGELGEAPSPGGAGPARTFRFPGAPGTVGFISPLSQPFCSECNRLRVTADGKLRPCLSSDVEFDLVPALRAADKRATLTQLVRLALLQKPGSHRFLSHRSHSRRMCQIGG
ncbi:MAG: GTP 3',8-cyclase MoaA [Bacillota bacterium]